MTTTNIDAIRERLSMGWYPDAPIASLLREVDRLTILGDAMYDECQAYWRGDGPKGSFDSVRAWRTEVRS